MTLKFHSWRARLCVDFVFGVCVYLVFRVCVRFLSLRRVDVWILCVGGCAYSGRVLSVCLRTENVKHTPDTKSPHANKKISTPSTKSQSKEVCTPAQKQRSRKIRFHKKSAVSCADEIRIFSTAHQPSATFTNQFSCDLTLTSRRSDSIAVPSLVLLGSESRHSSQSPHPGESSDARVCSAFRFSALHGFSFSSSGVVVSVHGGHDLILVDAVFPPTRAARSSCQSQTGERRRKLLLVWVCCVRPSFRSMYIDGDRTCPRHPTGSLHPLQDLIALCSTLPRGV